jgi:ribosomal protein S18 acetylase RimI-like enzyme
MAVAALSERVVYSKPVVAASEGYAYACSKVKNIFFGAAVGALIGGCLGAFTFSLILGGVIGLAIGVIIGIRIKVLRNPAKINAVEEAVKGTKLVQTVQKIKNLIKHVPINMTYRRTHHELHDHLTRVTDEMATQDGKIKEVWRSFLKSIDKAKIAFQDKGTTRLDVTPELERLDGKKPTLVVEAATDQDYAEVVKLEEECFGPAGTFTVEQLQERADFMIVARNVATKKVIGFLWSEINHERGKPQVMNVSGVGRAASAAGLGVGQALFSHFIKGNSHFPGAITLHVAEHNLPAQKLYQRFGLKQVRLESNYYAQTGENAFLMQQVCTILPNGQRSFSPIG